MKMDILDTLNEEQLQVVTSTEGYVRVITGAGSGKTKALWIVKQIKLLLDLGKSLKDIVILYRAHYLSRSVEEAFIKEDIKYTMYSGIEFYKRKKIKDVLCYLRMIIWQNKAINFRL